MPEITILADNRVASPYPRGLRGEWGFSVAIGDVLLDTGQSAAVHNAKLLDVPVEEFDSVVVSHSHFDHTSGLLDVLNVMDQPSLYCHPDVWDHRYLDQEGQFDGAPLGIPYTKSTVEAKADIVEHRDPVEVTDGVHALGQIPRSDQDYVIGKVEREKGDIDDPIVDDQSVVVETDDGLALVLGCCHAGLRNTVKHAESVCNGDVRYIIGGTHLIAVDSEEIHTIADWLAGKLDLLVSAHCTGTAAMGILNERLPEIFEPAGVGSTIKLEGV
ncbi:MULTISPECIES: MBL fold metallo-hydrolase [unclassified Haloarcula]|uniref:MBL fold metallo-hydrolase n=1 Tax=unclassified Haloarcula TaxID=2624677 RepID=UPI000678FE2F|nr:MULTISPECIES: MBL fold metallo-hydrolase [unclassified Haloarcula]